MKKTILIIISLLTANIFADEDPVALTTMVALPTKQTVVTEEGALEPDEKGSYTIRLYDTDQGSPDALIFRSGIIRPRNGKLNKVQVTDINDDEKMEIIVLFRSSVTSNTQSAEIFSFENNELNFLNSVENLTLEADPLMQIRQSN